ncbi:MAG: hypothetical protein ACP5FL_03145 [Thermoplasmatota archaeon]
MKHALGSILLSSILAISGILVIILNMFHENIPAYVGLGVGLIMLGVIIHFWSDGQADAEP